MRHFHIGRYTFCAAAAFAMLAGCGGGMSPGQPAAIGPSATGRGATGTAAQMRALGVVGAVIYGVSSRDFATFVSATVLIVLVSFAASLIPALRATRVDPLAVLREE